MEISKNLFCISMRNGVEIWEEEEKIQKLQEMLGVIKQSTFVHFGNQTINTADIVGIFDASTMADHTRRKNGNWQCKYGNWHDRGEKCQEEEEKIKKLLNNTPVC